MGIDPNTNAKLSYGPGPVQNITCWNCGTIKSCIGHQLDQCPLCGKTDGDNPMQCPCCGHRQLLIGTSTVRCTKCRHVYSKPPKGQPLKADHATPLPKPVASSSENRESGTHYLGTKVTVSLSELVPIAQDDHGNTVHDRFISLITSHIRPDDPSLAGNMDNIAFQPTALKSVMLLTPEEIVELIESLGDGLRAYNDAKAERERNAIATNDPA